MLKKLKLGILAFALFPSFVFASFTFDENPTTGTGSNTTSTVTGSYSGSDYYYFFDTSGAYACQAGSISFSSGVTTIADYIECVTSGAGELPDGTYHAIHADASSINDAGICDATGSYTNCLSYGGFIADIDLVVGSGGGGGGGGSTTTSATTTQAYLGSIAFGINIIIVLLFIGFVGYIWNSFEARKKPWQK